MYTPVQPGIPHALRGSVHYQEFAPRNLPSSLVYRFWTLKATLLERDFEYLVLPDGCIDIVFDLHSPSATEGALIMTPNTTAVTLNLKRSFHYAGVRLYPGAWHQDPVAVIKESRIIRDIVNVSLADFQTRLRHADHPQDTLEEMCTTLYQENIIQPNHLIDFLLTHEWSSIEEAAHIAGYSVRHIQRVLLDSVGYKPHDFLKIIRFQRALSKQDFSQYADQSHYIREFKRITGMTPQTFHATYQNMS